MASVSCFLALDSRASSLLRNSLLLVAGTWAGSLPLGIVLAWVLVRTDLPGRGIALLLFGLMLFVPLYLQAAAWQAGFGLQGWCTAVWKSPPLLEGWRGVLWIHGVTALPWIVLIVGAGLRRMEPELEEQALLDASSWRVFLKVTLRGALGAILVASLWVAILVAGEMTVTDLFAIRTYAEEIYTTLAAQSDEPPVGAAPGILLIAWLLFAGLTLAARLTPSDRPLSLRARWIFRLGVYRWPLAAFVGLLLVLLIGVPLGNLAYQAGILVVQSDAGWTRSWSLGKCASMIVGSLGDCRREVRWSLLIGVFSATTAVGTAAIFAWLARRGGWRSGIILFMTALALAVPGPLIGLALLWLRGVWVLRWLVDHWIFAPWAALTIRSLPPSLLILWYAFRTIPPAILDAAEMDGAGPAARFWRIALPSRISAVLLAWLVAFAVAMGDLAASILVVPPGVTTLSIHLFGLLHYGVQDKVAGACLALLAVFATIAAGILGLVGRWNQEGSSRNDRPAGSIME